LSISVGFSTFTTFSYFKLGFVSLNGWLKSDSAESSESSSFFYLLKMSSSSDELSSDSTLSFFDGGSNLTSEF
jgi:hypothetical protein